MQTERKGYLKYIGMMQGYMTNHVDIHHHRTNWTHLQSANKKPVLAHITSNRNTLTIDGKNQKKNLTSGSKKNKNDFHRRFPRKSNPPNGNKG